MPRNMTSTLLAVVGIALLSVALPLSIARGQTSTAAVPGAAPGQFTNRPPQVAAPQFPDQMGGMRAGGGGGGSTMIADDRFLYVLKGDRLFKITKDNLNVVKEALLPGPMQPGVGGRQRGGEVGGPLPPSEIDRGGGGWTSSSK